MQCPMSYLYFLVTDLAIHVTLFQFSLFQFILFCSRNPYLAILLPDIEQVNNYAVR
jgi:hypothetical protein